MKDLRFVSGGMRNNIFQDNKPQWRYNIEEYLLDNLLTVQSIKTKLNEAITRKSGEELVHIKSAARFYTEEAADKLHELDMFLINNIDFSDVDKYSEEVQSLLHIYKNLRTDVYKRGDALSKIYSIPQIDEIRAAKSPEFKKAADAYYKEGSKEII